MFFSPELFIAQHSLNAATPKWEPIKVEAKAESIAKAKRELEERKSLMEKENNGTTKEALQKRIAHDEANIKVKEAEFTLDTKPKNTPEYESAQDALNFALKEQQQKINDLLPEDKLRLIIAGIKPQLITPPPPPTQTMVSIHTSMEKVKEDALLSDQDLTDLSTQISNHQTWLERYYNVETLQQEINAQRTPNDKIKNMLEKASYVSEEQASLSKYILDVDEAQRMVRRDQEQGLISAEEAQKKLTQYSDINRSLQDNLDFITGQSIPEINTIRQTLLAQETNVLQRALQAIKEWAESFANFFSGSDAHLRDSSSIVDTLLSKKEVSLDASQRVLLSTQAKALRDVVDQVSQGVTQSAQRVLSTADDALERISTGPIRELNILDARQLKLPEQLENAKLTVELNLDSVNVSYEMLMKYYETPLIALEASIRKYKGSDPTLFQHLLKEYDVFLGQTRTAHLAQKYLFSDAVLLEMAKDPSVSKIDIATLADPLLYRSDPNYPATVGRYVTKALEVASKLYDRTTPEYQNAYKAYIILRDPAYYKFLKEYDTVTRPEGFGITDPYGSTLPEAVVNYLNDKKNALAQQEIDEFTQGLLKEYHIELKNINNSLYSATKQLREITGTQQLLLELLDAKIAEVNALNL